MLMPHIMRSMNAFTPDEVVDQSGHGVGGDVENRGEGQGHQSQQEVLYRPWEGKEQRNQYT